MPSVAEQPCYVIPAPGHTTDKLTAACKLSQPAHSLLLPWLDVHLHIRLPHHCHNYDNA